jgi:Family of unknown function (DUF5367)
MIARWMVVGFILWIGVAAAFRFAGHELFQQGQGVMWLFLTLPIGTLVVTYALLKLMRVAPTDRAEAASIMVVPGLLVGIYEITNYATVFPNLDVGLNGAFASLMFACYTAMIIAGIVASRLQSI